MFTVETDLGSISVGKNAFGKIVTEAVDSFQGKVLISNHKGKVPGNLASKMSDVNTMEISFGKNGTDIRVFIVIRFGTSITMVTNQLVDEIHRNIHQMTGREPNSVAVVVTGIFSKNIAKRHIEVSTK